MFYVALFLSTVGFHVLLASKILPHFLDPYYSRKVQLTLANNACCFIYQNFIIFNCLFGDIENMIRSSLAYFFYDVLVIVMEYPKKSFIFFGHHIVSIYGLLHMLRMCLYESRAIPWLRACLFLVEITTPLLTIKDTMFLLGMTKREMYKTVYTHLVRWYFVTRLLLLPAIASAYAYLHYPISFSALNVYLCLISLLVGSVRWWLGLRRQALKLN
jgi:hypothetical protein